MLGLLISIIDCGILATGGIKNSIENDSLRLEAKNSGSETYYDARCFRRDVVTNKICYETKINGHRWLVDKNGKPIRDLSLKQLMIEKQKKEIEERQRKYFEENKESILAKLYADNGIAPYDDGVQGKKYRDISTGKILYVRTIPLFKGKKNDKYYNIKTDKNVWVDDIFDSNYKVQSLHDIKTGEFIRFTKESNKFLNNIYDKINDYLFLKSYVRSKSTLMEDDSRYAIDRRILLSNPIKGDE